MNDIRQQAERRYEREQEKQRELAERQKEADREQGIRSHITTIQRRRDEERREQARREAAKEADALAVELGERATDLQRDAEALARSIEEYADLRSRLEGAHRRSGRGAGGSRASSLKPVLGGWFRSVFGGHGSLVGVPSEMAGRVRAVGHGPRALIERDTLASPVTSRTEGEAS